MRSFPISFATQIPAGIAGITIAGVLAAAMSSLDSSINAVSTVTVVDILKPYLFPGRSDRFYLVFARCLATAAAVVMILGAIGFSLVPKESIADLTLIIASVFGGCMVGLFLLGFFTTRVDYGSALIALALAIALNIYFMLDLVCPLWLPAAIRPEIHSYWVGIIVNVTFAVLAYGISLLRNRQKKDLTGLTVWTLQPAKGNAQ